MPIDEKDISWDNNIQINESDISWDKDPVLSPREDQLKAEVQSYTPDSDPEEVKAEAIAQQRFGNLDPTGAVYLDKEVSPVQQVDELKKIDNPTEQDAEVAKEIDDRGFFTKYYDFLMTGRVDTPVKNRNANDFIDALIAPEIKSIASGTISLATGIAYTPKIIEDANIQLQTKIMEWTGIDEKLRSDVASEIEEIQSMRSGYFDDIKSLKKFGEKISPIAKFDKDIMGYMKSGEYSKAVSRLWLSIFQQSPQMGMQVAAAATGTAPLVLPMMGMSAAGTKYIELEDSDLSPEAKILNASLTGTFEVLAEKFGTFSQLDKIAAKPLKRTIMGFVKSLIPMGVEGAEEAITQVSENVTDSIMGVKRADGSLPKWNDGLSEATIIGTFMGGTATTLAIGGMEPSTGNRKLSTILEKLDPAVKYLGNLKDTVMRTGKGFSVVDKNINYVNKKMMAELDTLNDMAVLSEYDQARKEVLEKNKDNPFSAMKELKEVDAEYIKSSRTPAFTGWAKLHNQDSVKIDDLDKMIDGKEGIVFINENEDMEFIDKTLNGTFEEMEASIPEAIPQQNILRLDRTPQEGIDYNVENIHNVDDSTREMNIVIGDRTFKAKATSDVNNINGDADFEVYVKDINDNEDVRNNLESAFRAETETLDDSAYRIGMPIEDTAILKTELKEYDVARLKKEESYENKPAEEKTIRPGAIQKAYNDFIDWGISIENKTGIKTTPLFKNIEANFKIVEDMVNEKKDDFRELFGKKYHELRDNEQAKLELVKYFTTENEIGPMMEADVEFAAMASYLKGIIKSTHPMIRAERVRAYLEGRQDKADYGTDEMKNALDGYKAEVNAGATIDSVVARVESGQDPNADAFVRDNYFPLKLDEEIGASLFRETDPSVYKGQLKSRKGGEQYYDGDPITKVMGIYRTALDLKYLDKQVIQAHKIGNMVFDPTTRKQFDRQLKSILGKSDPKTSVEFEESFRRIMGMGYALGVAGRTGTLQFKNFFQKAQNIKDFKDIKEFFSGERKYVKQFGNEMANRIKKEMLQKKSISELSGLSDESISQIIPEFLEAMNPAKFAKRLKQDLTLIPAIPLNVSFNNPVAQLLHRSIGKGGVWAQNKMDEINRYNGMFLWQNKADKVLNDQKMSWDDKKKELGYPLISKQEQNFLNEVLAKEGKTEFGYQLGKLFTTKGQYQYSKGLRSLWSQSDNIILQSINMYQTWSRGWGKRHGEAILSAVKNKDGKALTKHLALSAFTMAMANVIYKTIIGKLDDDDPVKGIGKAAVEPFIGKAYEGKGGFERITNIGKGTSAMGGVTTIPYIDTYNMARNMQTLHRDPTATNIFRLIGFGQAGQMSVDAYAGYVNMALYLSTDSNRDKPKYLANALDAFDRNMDTLYLPYYVLSNLDDVVDNERDSNELREILDKRYRKRKQKKPRDWYEMLQHTLWEGAKDPYKRR